MYRLCFFVFSCHVAYQVIFSWILLLHFCLGDLVQKKQSKQSFPLFFRIWEHLTIFAVWASHFCLGHVKHGLLLKPEMFSQVCPYPGWTVLQVRIVQKGSHEKSQLTVTGISQPSPSFAVLLWNKVLLLACQRYNSFYSVFKLRVIFFLYGWSFWFYF